MSSYRRARINDAVKEELSLALRDVKDPRVSDVMISITAAEVAPDLREAKVYYSVFGGEKKEAAAGLASAAGYLRREVARRLNLRITPTLSFVEDDSMEHGARISRLIAENTPEPEEKEQPSSEMDTQ